MMVQKWCKIVSLIGWALSYAVVDSDEC